MEVEKKKKNPENSMLRQDWATLTVEVDPIKMIEITINARSDLLDR